jgi:hypothetical protein
MRSLRLLLPAAAAVAVLTLTPAFPAFAEVTIDIDKSAQQMTVTVDGVPRYSWTVSTGAPGYDTPSGDFKPFRMERDHFSREWDDAPMPHSIFFTQKGHAIHGSGHVRAIGTPASHGCVRLAPANAKTLFELVEQEGVLNTTVVLTGVAPSGAPAVARRRVPPVDDLEESYVQQQAPQVGPRYGSNQPVYGNPYYAQPQYAQPQYAQPQYVQPQPQYQPYGQPQTLPRPGYVYRDPYSGQVYQQPRPRSLFPFE